MGGLLDAVTAEHISECERKEADVTGERFGCEATDDRQRKACALYLWLLGPTTEQLATECPCRTS